MFGDNGLAVDLDAAEEAVAEADVMVIGFDFMADRLLLDMRGDAHRHTPPLVEIVEPLASAQERAVWLSARRPGVLPPERFVFFVWPHTIEYLEASPVLDGIARRISTDHGLEMRGELSAAATELRRRERQHTVSAVRGHEGFETLWARRN
jgi:hypothetical protein